MQQTRLPLGAPFLVTVTLSAVLPERLVLFWIAALRVQNQEGQRGSSGRRSDKGSVFGVGTESRVLGGECVGEWEVPTGAEHLWLRGQPREPSRSGGAISLPLGAGRKVQALGVGGVFRVLVH